MTSPLAWTNCLKLFSVNIKWTKSPNGSRGNESPSFITSTLYALELRDINYRVQENIFTTFKFFLWLWFPYNYILRLSNLLSIIHFICTVSQRYGKTWGKKTRNKVGWAGPHSISTIGYSFEALLYTATQNGQIVTWSGNSANLRIIECASFISTDRPHRNKW